jgi:2-succinyl-5-enolpyruvyl-6-hydroxy-3-cyclohexene-1-carboxylate synthase
LVTVNPSTALATVLVDELVAGGVREAVLCPGSRNAPLSFALHAADATGRLRLHVRIDERGAGFLALGLAARSGAPVPVACTSGTAAANLHPAVLEAHHAGVPLLALTADRPAELRDTGANQTIDQAGLYGDAVRWEQTVTASGDKPGANAVWRSTVCRALTAARGTLTGDPGPVHLNVALRPPLVPDGTMVGPEFAGRPGGHPWTAVLPAVSVVPAVPIEHPRLELAARTLVVAGQGGPPVPPWLEELPRMAEPGSPLWAGSLAAGPWLLGTGVQELRPDHVVVVGRPTLHRPVQDLLADPAVRVTVLTDRPQWTDVASTAVTVLRGAPRTQAGPAPDERWSAALREADAAATAALRAVLDDTPWPSGLAVARDLVAALPEQALLVLGSSNPIRDVALAATPRAGLTVHANRGVAGIDGTVSTAVGAALAHDGPSYALLGDLTVLHDATGFVIGPDEPRPDLTIVVFNDGGGGIFSLLEQGAPEHAAAFERIFGTPHGVDLAALCTATGIGYVQARTPAELETALAPRSGLSMVEVRADRTTVRQLHARLRAAVARRAATSR